MPTRRSAINPAAATIVAAGVAALVASVRPDGLEPGWLYAAGAALTGMLLWTLSAAPAASSPLFAGVAARIESPGRRAAVRALVLATAPVAGLGVIAYAAAAFYVTLASGPSEGRPVDWRTSVGTGFAGLAVVLLAVAAGLSVGSEGLLWSALLIGSGLALFWGAAGTQAAGDLGSLFESRGLRTTLGLLLVGVGGAVILNRTGGFGLDERTILGAAAVVVLGALVIGPRWLRGTRQLAAERRLRAREQDRAEVADVLHDSVLQTLALIQRRTDIPDEVAALARRQERELRRWLLRGERSGHAATSLDEALRAVVAEVEDDHGVAVEAVVVGNAPRSARTDALVAATREALVNAAKHGDGAQISLFAKAQDGSMAVYVHDRGPGFDPDAIDPERRGVRDSILARMDRIGGYAEINTAPGAGCEVTLVLRSDR